MRILGIDPGSQVTGYGIIDEQGSRLHHVDNGGIFTRPTHPFPEKLKTIFEGIQELIQRYTPQVLAIENIFYAKNHRSSFQLGHARGVAMVAAARSNLAVYEYNPTTIKQSVVGYGRASKEQIQQMVRNLLQLPETTFFDASDALAVAICHLHSSKFSEKVKKAVEKK